MVKVEASSSSICKFCNLFLRSLAISFRFRIDTTSQGMSQFTSSKLLQSEPPWPPQAHKCENHAERLVRVHATQSPYDHCPAPHGWAQKFSILGRLVVWFSHPDPSDLISNQKLQPGLKWWACEERRYLPIGSRRVGVAPHTTRLTSCPCPWWRAEVRNKQQNLHYWIHCYSPSLINDVY